MKPIFKIGDFIQHKDKDKRDSLDLKGEIIQIGVGNNNTTPFYLLQHNGVFAVLMENQNEYEKV